MSKTETYPWDPAEDLEGHEDCIGYLDAALQEDDALLVAKVLDDIARYQEMTRTGHELQPSPSSLYESLACDGEPKLGAILTALRELGISLYGGPRRCSTSEPQSEVLYQVQPVLE